MSVIMTTPASPANSRPTNHLIGIKRIRDDRHSA